MQAKGLFMKKK